MPRPLLILAVAGCCGTSSAAGPALDLPVPAVPAKGSAAGSAEAGAVWQRFLQAHVDDRGQVDYRAAAESADLARFVAGLAAVQPGDLVGSDARKAFWINAYNALAIYAVTQTIPDAPAARKAYSVIDQPRAGLPANKGFFRGITFTVGGRRWTLDEIEQQVLFRRWEGRSSTERAVYAAWAPDRGDPRLHFALVCCARGCPVLQRFAYRADRIDAQLAHVSAAFLNDPSRSRFDRTRRLWQVSTLLTWYGGDFTAEDHEPRADALPAFAARHVSDAATAAALTAEDWQIEYLPYDWSLNAQD